jgi:hypothetical protein
MVWRRLVWVMLGVGLLVTVAATGGVCAEGKINLNALVTELRKQTPGPDDMTIVLWFPEVFWRESAAANPDATAEGVATLLKWVRPYTVVAVVSAAVDDSGVPTYVPAARLRAMTRIRDARGVTYAPIDERQLAPEMRDVLKAMAPTMQNLMGKTGDNMRFFAFPAKDKQGKAIGDPTRPGSFSVLVGAREFTWKLPLKSLVPPKTCPTCGEKLDPAYKYCPWDGTKLGAG